MCVLCSPPNGKPLLKALDAYIAKADDDLIALLRDEGYIQPEDTVDFEKTLEDLLTAALKDETSYFLRRLGDALDIDQFAAEIWPDVVLTDDLRIKVAEIFKEQLQTFLLQYAGYYLAQTDNDLLIGSVSKRTQAWITSWSEELGNIMQLTSHTEIERILKDGLGNGDSIAEFTDRIMESGIRQERYRARTTALTETLRAHSVAQQESFMQSPVVETKIWRHSGSYRIAPRKNHQAMDGQRVPKGEPFTLTGPNGTYKCMYPRDPSLPASESINCHCIAQPGVNDDILGMPLEERQKLQAEAIANMNDDWERELDERNRAKAGIE